MVTRLQQSAKVPRHRICSCARPGVAVAAGLARAGDLCAKFPHAPTHFLPCCRHAQWRKKLCEQRAICLTPSRWVTRPPPTRAPRLPCNSTSLWRHSALATWFVTAYCRTCSTATVHSGGRGLRLHHIEEDRELVQASHARARRARLHCSSECVLASHKRRKSIVTRCVVRSC